MEKELIDKLWPLIEEALHESKEAGVGDYSYCPKGLRKALDSTIKEHLSGTPVKEFSGTVKFPLKENPNRRVNTLGRLADPWEPKEPILRTRPLNSAEAVELFEKLRVVKDPRISRFMAQELAPELLADGETLQQKLKVMILHGTREQFFAALKVSECITKDLPETDENYEKLKNLMGILNDN